MAAIYDLCKLSTLPIIILSVTPSKYLLYCHENISAKFGALNQSVTIPT